MSCNEAYFSRQQLRYVFLENVGPVFKVLLRSSSITFVGPFFTKFHRGGFLGIPLGRMGIPLGRIFKFTISKPLGGVLGPITLGIVADSKTIYPK